MNIQDEIEQVVSGIADELMSCFGQKGATIKCDRLQLMLAQADGEEINMGGRNRSSVEEAIRKGVEAHFLEIDRLHRQNKELQNSLKVIFTWAVFGKDSDDPVDQLKDIEIHARAAVEKCRSDSSMRF